MSFSFMAAIFVTQNSNGSSLAKQNVPTTAAPTAYETSGYIAGEDVGLFTIDGSAAKGNVLVIVEGITGIMPIYVRSNADGTYRIDNLNPSWKYKVIGEDINGVANSVIAARVTPKVRT